MNEAQKQKLREKSRKHRAAHPDKVRARQAGQVLEHQPCEFTLTNGMACGKMPTEAHHPSYKQPWRVQWFCKTHHEEVDTAQDRARSKNGNST